MPALFSLLLLDVRLRAWRYAFGWLLFASILILGSVPGARAEVGNYASGIVLHSLAYASVTLLLFTGSRGSARACAIKSVLTVMAMGAADELLQSQLPYRSGALADWAIDCNAAIFTAGLLWAWLGRRGRPAAATRE